MATPLTINGTTYQFPQQFDRNWGPTVTNWATAVTSGMLQKAGGSFHLTAEVDFGSSFGLKVDLLKSQETNIASTGFLRLGNASPGIVWRNALNNADLVLTVNASNQLTFNGTSIGATTALTNGHILVGNVSNQPADVAMSGDTTITNAGVVTIANSAITDAKVSASAAITLSKLAPTTAYYWYAANVSGVLTPLAVTASKAVATDANGLPTASATTATELGYLSGVTSAVQTQLNARLQLSGGTMSGNINMGSNKVTALTDPSSAQDAATKNYVDTAVSGTTNTVPRFTASHTLGNSALTDDGTTVKTSRVFRSTVNSGGIPAGTPVFEFFPGNGGIGFEYDIRSAVSAFNGATSICTFSSGESHDVMVSGRDSVTNKMFVDKLIVCIASNGTASSVTTYTTQSVGSPVARVYTMSGTTLQLNMSGNAVSYNTGILDTFAL